jgi:hypothetical protein
MPEKGHEDCNAWEDRDHTPPRPLPVLVNDETTYSGMR